MGITVPVNVQAQCADYTIIQVSLIVSMAIDGSKYVQSDNIIQKGRQDPTALLKGNRKETLINKTYGKSSKHQGKDPTSLHILKYISTEIKLITTIKVDTLDILR